MIASLLAFVGCQNEELVTKGDTIGKKVTLTANIAGTADSRVVLDAGTDNGEINGNPIVNVSWRQYNSENPEEFTVYNADYNQFSVFTQSESDNSKFEGTFPEGGASCAYYGNIWISQWGLFYDFSEQDGKLSEESVLMKADLTNASSEITFEHLTTILKPTFVVNSTEINNTAITNIVMNGVTAGRDYSGSYNSIIVEPSQLENIYIFLPIIDTDYATGHTFTFNVTANEKNYIGSLTISKDIEAGYVYTASIELTECCPLPVGENFRDAVLEVLNANVDVTSIEFQAGTSTDVMNDAESFGSGMPANAKYKIIDATLKIYTNLQVFKFNENCKYMFSASEGWGNANNRLATIISINFNDCVNTSYVETMFQMFYHCEALQSLDLSSFNTANVTNINALVAYCTSLQSLNFGDTFHTSNVTNMNYMFQYLGSIVQNTTMVLDLTKFKFTGFRLSDYIAQIFNSMNENIKVKVTEEGYNFLNGKISDYHVQQHLVKPDGTPWVTGADDIIPGDEY